ncbi:hypothetical protein AB1Y20_012684 [Prymnesium parvum]|uniref:Thioredoxin domain-containing protein n=1 Tax=Prymnesium parvum TaxID=97485 RepID=A0AB34IL82_PRYPA
MALWLGLIALAIRAAGAVPTEQWEQVDLEVPMHDSRVLDLTEESLHDVVSSRDGNPVIVWFYAPWCKQCKIARAGYEEAARRAPENGMPSTQVLFARLDCVKYPAVKEKYGVYSYPAFKVFRGPLHKWIELGRDRSTEKILAAASREAEGAYVLVEEADGLRALVFPDPPPSEAHVADFVGKGEAFAFAHLSSLTGPAAAAFHALASNCSIRLSPFPFLATTNASILEPFGLPALPLDSISIVQTISEPYGAPDEARAWPRLVSAPLVHHTLASTDGYPMADCQWVLGHRLPLLVDYNANIMWAKRAASLPNPVHALLFLSTPHMALAGTVRAAAARFVRGYVVVFAIEVSETEKPNAFLKRFEVNSVLDTPRLVFLDQRKPKEQTEERKRVFKESITEENVSAFLEKELQLPLESRTRHFTHEDTQAESVGKDEL